MPPRPTKTVVLPTNEASFLWESFVTRAFFLPEWPAWVLVVLVVLVVWVWEEEEITQ